MKFALFANEKKSNALEVRNDLANHLRELGATVQVEMCDGSEKIESSKIQKCVHECDFVVSIGGDGSILHLVHRLGIPHPPIIGVNLGTLGFLADISVQDLFGSFDAIYHKAYKVSERLVLDGCMPEGTRNFALNEIAIHRGNHPHIVDIALYVDGSFVNTFSADGLLVATPSGSTAYSLSAGGPIVTPETKAVVITLICPHTITNRPIILLPKQSISIELFHGADSVDVIFDGLAPYKLSRGKRIDLTVNPEPFRLVTLSTSDYYATLRSKLGWTGSLRV